MTATGYTHHPVKVGARKPRDLSQFNWDSAVFGNQETTLAGAYHALKYRKYAAHHLSAFASRFDRRFNLRKLVPELIVDIANCVPLTQYNVVHDVKNALHNPSRFVIARPRAVCSVAFIANSTRYWPQNAPCIPSRSALHTLALSYAEHPLLQQGLPVSLRANWLAS